jgi:hypothetical protein
MNAVAPIQSRVPNADYRALPAINITLLKELRRSALHFQYAKDHPKESAAMTVGTAAHCATLEPERFAHDFVIWDRKTDSGRAAPRNGKAWEAFVAEAGSRTVLTADEYGLAIEMAAAVRNDPVAAKYLESGEPEVTLAWEIDGRPCKGRVDWLTHRDGEPVVVGLKTARNCLPFAFGSAAAKLGYHCQWAFYHDGYQAIQKRAPRMVEIVVESTPPHAVVVYVIPEDVLEQGRDEYQELLRQLAVCERDDHWPGPAETEQILTLPSWVYGPAEEDLSDLQLE